MSSLFVSENNGVSQLAEPTRPKRPRSSLACIRCRKKKVKCDFVQPTCERCGAAGLVCNYATPPRRVDGHAFDQLGDYVEELKERMLKMQSELSLMKHNLHSSSTTTTTATPTPTPTTTTITGAATEMSSSMTATVSNNDRPDQPDTTTTTLKIPILVPTPPTLSLAPCGPLITGPAEGQSQTSGTWRLSISSSGLCIDTNIASVADLYRILLGGISQLNINKETYASLFDTSYAVKRICDTKNRQREDDKSCSSNGDSDLSPIRLSQRSNIPAGGIMDNSRDDKYVWKVGDSETRKINQQGKTRRRQQKPTKSKLNTLIQTSYHSCFVVYQIIDKDEFIHQYMREELDSLLINSINAWLSKHGCTFHNKELGLEGKDNYDTMRMGQEYFQNARQLLRKCFDISSPTTIHALLHLYMYQRNNEQSNSAYLYIGLAIRMAQDLKLHKKDGMMSNDNLKQREANKRLWWSAYWLDLCVSVESNRPTMVDDKDCDIEYPTRLDSEDDETGYRLNFCIYSIKLMRIRKDITKNLAIEQSGQTLLSAVSRLENALKHWMKDLPKDLRVPDSDDDGHHNNSKDLGGYTKNNEEEKICPTSNNKCISNGTRYDIMLNLNIQYQTTWIMLHKLFLPEQGQTATPVALLSLNICTKSANMITKMLVSCQVNWCQLGFALDGVVASVAIHKLNALSHERNIANLAQRNLVATIDLLKACPLIYMDKVTNTIDNIQEFLKENKLPEYINDIPPVNEDSINRQSISSVFHPGEFGSSSISLSVPSTSQQYNHIHDQEQQQKQNQMGPVIPSSSSDNNDHNMNSGAPSASLLFPPTSSITNSRSTSPTSTPSSLTSPVPMSISSSPHLPVIHIQQPTVTTNLEEQLPEQHTNIVEPEAQPVPVTIRHYQQQHREIVVQDTSNLLFDNYNALMGYNNYTSSTMQATGVMTTAPVNGSNDDGNNSMNSFFMGFDTGSSTTASSETFAQNIFVPGTMGGEDPQLFTSSHNRSSGNDNNEAFTPLTSTDASLLIPQHATGYSPHLMNNNTTATIAGNPSMIINNDNNTATTTQQQQFFAIQQAMARRYHHQQQNRENFDPSLFFNQFDPNSVVNTSATLLGSSVAMQQQPYIHHQQFNTIMPGNSNNEQQQRNHQTPESVFIANSTNNNQIGMTTNLSAPTFLQTETSRKRMREWGEE